MLVSPDAHVGKKALLRCVWLCSPLLPFSPPEHRQSEAWLYPRLGALSITHLLIMRLRVSVQTVHGTIYYLDNRYIT